MASRRNRDCLIAIGIRQSLRYRIGSAARWMIQPCRCAGLVGYPRVERTDLPAADRHGSSERLWLGQQFVYRETSPAPATLGSRTESVNQCRNPMLHFCL